MIRFGLEREVEPGVTELVKYEFDDDRLLNTEAIALKKATGFNVRQFWEAFNDADPVAWTGMVWLARRRAGEPDLRFSDVEFDLATLNETLVAESEDEPGDAGDPPGGPAGGSSSGEPTP